MIKLFKRRPNLPSGYQIVRDGRGYKVQYYLGYRIPVTIGYSFTLRQARKTAWDHCLGKGDGSIVEKG